MPRERIRSTVLTLSQQTNAVRHIAQLTAFQAVSQAIVILSVPLVTRLYTPADIGTAGALVALLAIAGPVICLRLEQAILIERSNRMAAAATMVALLAAGAMASALSIVVLVIFGPWLASHGFPPRTTTAIVFVSLVLSGVCGVVAQWSLRLNHLHQFGAGRASRPAVATLLSVLFPALGFGSKPIFIVLSTMAGVLVELLINVRNKSGALMGTGSRRRMIATVSRHFDLVAKSSPAALLNTLSWQLPTIVLAVTLGPAAAGAYSLGIRTVHLPLTVLASALSTLLQQRYLKAIPVKRAEIIGRFLHLSVRVVLPPTAAAMVAGPTLAGIVLGEDWAVAGEFARYLAIGIAAWFVSSPLSFVFNLHRNHEAELRSQVVILALKIVALSACLISNLNIVVACSLGLSMLLAYGYLLFEILSTTRVRVAWRKVILMPLLVSAGGTTIISTIAIYAAEYSSAACVVTVVLSIVASWFALVDTEVRAMLRD